MTGRKFSTERSLLSGLSGWLTMEMTQQFYMNDRDLRSFIRDIYNPKEGERMNVENIRRGVDGQKIFFDLRAEQAELVLEKIANDANNEIDMEVAAVLPQLEQPEPRYGGMRGGRGGDRGGRRDFNGGGRGGSRRDFGGRGGRDR